MKGCGGERGERSSGPRKRSFHDMKNNEVNDGLEALNVRKVINNEFNGYVMVVEDFEGISKMILEV